MKHIANKKKEEQYSSFFFVFPLIKNFTTMFRELNMQ